MKHVWGLLLAVAGPIGWGWAAEGGHFERRVAPLLRQRCLSCHNADRKRGGLDLTSRAGLLRGGADGPVVAPGKPGQSRLLEMVSGAKPAMPRSGKKLTADEVA